MGVAVIFCFTVCGMGLRRGVERVVKFMMVGLFALMIALVVRAVTLPGGEAGISFYPVSYTHLDRRPPCRAGRRWPRPA